MLESLHVYMLLNNLKQYIILIALGVGLLKNTQTHCLVGN